MGIGGCRLGADGSQILLLLYIPEKKRHQTAAPSLRASVPLCYVVAAMSDRLSGATTALSVGGEEPRVS